MAVTVPETLEWMGAARKAVGSPIFCPTSTRSPFLTMQRQGEPRCCCMGMDTTGGRGMSMMELFSVFLEWAIRMPRSVFARSRLNTNNLHLISAFRLFDFSQSGVSRTNGHYNTKRFLMTAADSSYFGGISASR